MAVVCPAILAENPHIYREQMERVAPFAKRVQIDLTDGDFASTHTIGFDEVWWPAAVLADLHLMYRQPMDYIDQIINLKPHLVIVHAEADVHHMHFAALLHKADIKAGLCVLPDTPIVNVEQILHSFDHLLIFSGNLGQYGGKADLSLLAKGHEAKGQHTEVEIGWDGGVNAEIASALIEGGVDVLNTGGFIQNAEDPEAAYATLKQIVEAAQKI